MKVYDSAIAVQNTISSKLTATQLGLRSMELPWHTFEYTAFLTLLPEEKADIRFAHPEVGTRNLLITDYPDVSDLKKSLIVSRPKLSADAPKVYYIDTLLSEPIQKITREAIQEWNDALTSLDLPARIEARPFPRDKGFDPENPAFNVILLSNNPGASTSFFNRTDPRTGEILSSRVTVGRGAYDAYRTLGMLRISSVDERYRDYFVSEEVVSEALKNSILKNIGYTLGMATNLAGSMAYTPEELSSPEFTQKNGLSASIMDNVLFNGMAKQGDRERGLKLVSDVIGPANKLVLSYLYSAIPEGADEKEYLDGLVKVHYGDPRYRFLQTSTPRLTDPRGEFSDFSSDPIVSTYNRLEQTKYVFNHITSWLDSDDIPTDFKSSIPAQLFSEVYFNILQPLLSYVGGVYVDGRATPTGEQSYKPVLRELQKEIVKTFLNQWDSLGWIDQNRALLDYSGSASSMTKWAVEMGIPMKQMMLRLANMELSIRMTLEGEKPYTQDEFLSDIEEFVFADVKARKPISEQKFRMLEQYLDGLAGLSPTLKALSKIPLKSRFSLHADVEPSVLDLYQGIDMPQDAYEPDVNATAITYIPYYVEPDLTQVAFRHLELTRNYLRSALGQSRDKRYRTKVDFFITQITQIIGK